MVRLVQPVILAGGAGTRLWPDSTPRRPKHLLELMGEGSLLQQTVARVADSALFTPPMIVCAEMQGDEIGATTNGCSVILETVARGSAAAVALAAHSVAPDTLLLVLPSDHHIADPAPLFEAVRNAISVADEGQLVTFGIKPEKPETGFGYIIADGIVTDGVLRAAGFLEKPAKEKAEELIQSGTAFWNSGMFLFTAGAFLDELKLYAPAIHDATSEAVERAESDGRRIVPDSEALERSPTNSVDYAVMEHSHRIAIVPLDMTWSDVGSWAAVFELSQKDESGNVVDEGSHALDSRDCLIRSSGPKIVAIGVEDLVIVATPDHVLIVPRSEAQRVREAAMIANGDSAKRG